VLEKPLPEAARPGLEAVRELAARRELDFVGSLLVRPMGKRVVNRSYMLSSAGEIVAQYDKLICSMPTADGEVFGNRRR